MKKSLLALVMGVIMITLAACGGGNKHSKAFNQSKKVLDGVLTSIEKAKTCDDLDMAAFGILGLLGVEGVDAIPEAEQDELTKLTEKIDKELEAKKAEFNCQDTDLFGGDDDAAFDDLFEGME